jgi:hypothetical protein
MIHLTDAEYNELWNLARRLALALADECTFMGDDTASEESLAVLSIARDKLGLAEEFDKLDSLRFGG